MAAQGYIGRAPGESSVVVGRQTFTPTGITTNFTFASGYTVGYVDAYLNGVRLIEGNDYTATDGSVVGLTTHAQNGDVLELVVYKAFNIGNVTNSLGNFDVNNNLTVGGTSEFTGAITATGGVVGNVTGDATGLSGTPDLTIRNLTGVAATFTGVLSYDDVTNVDSVGYATFRSGINVQGAGSTTTTLNVSGVTTMTGDVNLGADFNIPDAITHVGDSNTKIRFPAADTFTVETGGNERLRIDSSGNLLIGTTSATSELTVRGGGTVAAFEGTGGSGSIMLKDVDNSSLAYVVVKSGNFDIQTSGSSYSTKLRVTPAGDVGIGNDASFPIYTDATDRTLIIGTGSNDSAIQIHSGTTNYGAVYFGDATSGNARYSGYVEYKHNDNFIRFGTNEAERLRIASSGQIGLGGANYGSAGQVITSNGSGSAPTWQDASGGISTQAGTASGIVTSMFLNDATDHKVTATGICTITTTQSGTEGQSHTIRIVNSGIATVGFSTYFLFPSGSAPVLPIADGAVSIISFTVHDSVGAGCTQLLAGASVNFS